MDLEVRETYLLRCRLEPTPKQRSPEQVKEFTHDEIAAELGGISRERVRQIEVRAIKKCRLWCIARGLRFEDLVPFIR